MKIKWVNVVMDNMLKTKRIGTFKCSYVVLISRILDHFKVEVKTKIKDLVEPEYELKTKVLKHMGYVEGEDGSDWIEKSKESRAIS